MKQLILCSVTGWSTELFNPMTELEVNDIAKELDKTLDKTIFWYEITDINC